MHIRTTTPLMQKVRDIADEAKNSEEGITLTFRVERHGGLKAAKSAARGMQMAFSALRSRERRIAQNMAGESQVLRDGVVRGIYDSIVCELIPLDFDEGYKIVFTPDAIFGMDWEVTDNKTGLPIENINPTDKRVAFLVAKVFKDADAARKERRARKVVLTAEENAFVWQHNPIAAEGLGLPKPDDGTQEALSPKGPAPKPLTGYESVDLADLSEDELVMDEYVESGRVDTEGRAGEYIQRAMPQLSEEEREFLLTGATPEEWENEFGDDD